MIRRILFIFICVAPLLVAAEKPNIILVMCDDLGWGDVGFNGNKIIRTPHLDAMAKNSIRFERFYAAAPVCSPTRGSCITGRHPYRYGVYFANTGHMKTEELTLAELLKKHGYATGHFGKWHLGTLTKTETEANRGGPRGVKNFSPPQVNGFDVCFSTESKVPTWDPMLRPKNNKSKTWWDPAKDNVPYGTAYWNEKGARVTENLRGDDSRVIMDRAIPFIRAAVKKEQPFFTIVWFHAPHLPVVAGPEYTKLYAKHEKFAQHYYGCITALDKQVGRLRKELRTLGVADNTLVTFCSDNGPEGNASAPGSAGHFSGRKRSLLEGGIRVPGLVEWPAKINPGKSDIPAVTSDYLPTILEIIGAEQTDKRPLDGISLVPLFKGKMKERGQPIGFQSAGQVALISDRYKIYGSGGRKKEQELTLPKLKLFDLKKDPSEKKDLAAQHPDIIKKMAATLKQWRESCRHSDTGGDYKN
ncbi:sulfatase-like hydrolase/transferase [Verrucomicrobia bacterium]|nr:sulfatase-like hydrolase/transferase [Verrucomicrobiota bacterium]MDC0219100.1 sulfatase-like hydrolase/transferase [Verrucomicrobiota bacterium]